MRVTNRINDARRIYERLSTKGETARPYLLRMCGGSNHRLAQAIAQLRNDGHDVQCVTAGKFVWYKLA